MFFTGTLQEGIASALQSNKAVACFVTDEGEESQLWETEWLKEETVAEVLVAHTVLLRLKAGTEEAGFLTALFPVPRNPTVVILLNGTLKEYIAAGTTREDFVKRMRSALNRSAQAPAVPDPSPSAEATPAMTTAPAPVDTSATAQSSVPGQPAATAPETSGSTTDDSPRAATPPTDSERPDAVRSVFAERAERLAREREEAKRKAQEAYARAKAAKGKERADPSKDEDKDKKPSGQSSYADALKKKQRAALDERKRILKQIEDDRIERRERQAERERAKRDSTSGDVAAALTNAPASGIKRPSGMVSLQVRLFDGSTMRSRFPGGNTLANDVRKWIDGERKDGGGPYKFKVVLTPLPNKTIEETEEEKSLGEIGLAPSSTLILMPIPKYSSAYGQASPANQGFFGRIIAFFAWLFGLVVGFVTSLFSTAGAPAPAPQVEQQVPLDDQRAEPEARGLRRRPGGSEAQRDHQLYNGNSLNFEPRPEDEDEGS